MTETNDLDECILRQMNCELNQLSAPDGSAMFMQGETAVLAGIYGPIEGKVQKMMYDRACVEVTYSPMSGPPKVDDRMMELYIKETCEAALIVTLHPGSSISINVQELQDSGGILACTINASCLALINSGLAMKFTVAAVCCAIVEGGKIILDPDANLSQEAKATLTFVFDSVKKDIVSSHSTGSFTEKELFECMDKCKQASQHIFDFYRDIVKKYANVI